MTPPLSIFRVAPYSPSTSRITIHRDNAVHLHKFLTDEGMALEAMMEATGTVLRGYVDEAGVKHLEAEADIITFVADATPSMLQPLLQRWLDGIGAEAPASPQADEQSRGVGEP